MMVSLLLLVTAAKNDSECGCGKPWNKNIKKKQQEALITVVMHVSGRTAVSFVFGGARTIRLTIRGGIM